MPSTDFDLLPSTRRALCHRLATAQVEGRAPSVVAAVVRDGSPVWLEGRGAVDRAGDLQYRIGSITKTFVTVLVLRLRDEGLLSLSATVPGHDITVGSVLSHTAGLAAEPPGPWWERTPGSLRPSLAGLVTAPPRAEPRFHYANPGFALLGALIEEVRGEPWFDVVRREVLTPLGMNRTSLSPVAPHATGWAVHPWADVLLPEPSQDLGLMAPAGAMWSTAGDLGRFAAFLLDGDDRVLSASSLAEMRLPASPPEPASWDSGYGLGTQLLRRGGRLLSGHTGSLPGFVAAVWVSVADGVGSIVLSNTTSGLRVAGLAAELLETVADLEPRLPAPWTPLPSADQELLALTGPWYWGPAPYVVRLLADGWLSLGALGAGRQTRLRPIGVDRWEGLDDYFAGETLQVVRDPSGAVTHLDLGTFVFTRAPYGPAEVVPGGVDPAGFTARPL